MLARHTLRRFALVSTIAASFCGAAVQAAAIDWITGTTADASGTWDGTASTFNGQAYSAADDLFINGSAAKTITTLGTITSPLSLTVNSTGATTLTGTSIGGILTKNADGALTLSTANTFGNVTINGGKFVLNNAAGLGTTGTLNVNAGAASGVAGSYAAPGAAFFYDSVGIDANYTFSKDIAFGTVGSATTYGMAMRGGTSRTTTLSGNISGEANVTLWLDSSTIGDNTAIWSLTGDNSGFAGTVRLNRGRLILGNANALGTSTLFLQTPTNVANGNLSFTGFTSLSNNIIIGATTGQTFNTAAADITLSGVMSSFTSGSGGITKIGTGKLTLTGANTYNGSATTVSAGTLSILGTGRINSSAYTGTLALTAANSVLEYASSTDQILSGVVSGAGSITKSGTSTLTLSAANTYSGTTTVSGGTLALGNSAAIQNSTLNLAAGTGTVSFGSLTSATLGGLAGSRDLVLQNDSAAAVAITVGGNNATTAYSGVLSGPGSLNKTGTGTLALSSANTFSGKTVVSSGNLELANPQAVQNSTLELSGGSVQFTVAGTNTYAVGGLSGYSNLNAGSNALSVGGNNTSTAYKGNITANTLTKSGTGSLTLAGSNTLNSVAINGGTIVAATDAALGTGPVTLASGTLELRQSANITNEIVLTGAASSNILGSGIQADYLVVGGGGGGAGRDSGGGGGGGGVVSSLNSTSNNAPLALSVGENLSINVGAGGAGAPNNATGNITAANGAASSLGVVTAAGGGGGGAYSFNGGAGASGGGGGRSFLGGAGTPGQGFNGGNGSGGVSATVDTGGGGGGAGGLGGNGIASTGGGNGGVGLAIDITGTNVFYGGGGGGTPHRNATGLLSGTGGIGGGGAGAANASLPTAGGANTGGGGGASRSATTGFDVGAAGGSGLVVVRYWGNQIATGGTVTAGTGTSTGYTLHTFTSVGAASLLFNQTISSTISGNMTGSGGFTWDSPNTLVLAGTNTYTGETRIANGTLVVSATGSLANNGPEKIFVAAPDSVRDASDPKITRAVAGGTNYATAFPTGFGSTSISTDPLTTGTTAAILAGTTTTSADVSMQWRSRQAPSETDGSDPNTPLSDVVNLTGMPTGDVFLLQMSYNQAALSDLNLNEDAIATSGELRLGWFDTNSNSWETAVAGNSGGTSNFVGIMSAADFLAQPGTLASKLGSYGVDPSDPTGGVVWAVVNHNSEFAVIPEPSTLVLGGLALLGFAGFGLRRRRQGFCRTGS